MRSILGAPPKFIDGSIFDKIHKRSYNIAVGNFYRICPCIKIEIGEIDK